MPQPIRIVLNTRYGTLRAPGDFSSCKWFLPDPVIAPDARHRLFVDVTFTAIPGDHRRLTRARGTTRLLMESRDKEGVLEYHEAEVPDGSYTREGFLRAMSRAMCVKVYRDIEEKQETAVPLDYKPVQLLRASDSDLHSHETQETMLMCTGERGFRIVHDGEHLAAEVLGFHETSLWTQGVMRQVVSHSAMDTQGTRTMTICATELAGTHPDPVRRERRRSVLRVLPMLGDEKHTPIVWHRPACKDGHPIGARCLSAIELELRDDMDLPLDPRHHWAVAVEVYADEVEHFASLM